MSENKNEGVIVGRKYSRRDDMSGDGKLSLILEEDGDVCIEISKTNIFGKFRSSDLQFCNCGSGGGRSPHTLKALRNLVEAIQKDNTKG